MVGAHKILQKFKLFKQNTRRFDFSEIPSRSWSNIERNLSVANRALLKL